MLAKTLPALLLLGLSSLVSFVAQADPITLTDVTGRQVVLPKPAERVHCIINVGRVSFAAAGGVLVVSGA